MRTKVAGIGLLLAAALVVGGCHSTYHDLKPVEQLPEYATRASACASLPHEEGRTVVAETPSGDLELAWCETRATRSDWLIVAIPGVLSTHRNWQFVAGELGRHCDLLLVDLLGSGDSSKPDPDDVAPGTYGPSGQARLIWELIRSRLEAGGRSRRLVLLGHSFGGMTVLRMLGDRALREEYAYEIGLVERIVMLAPVDFSVEKIPPKVWRLAHVSGLEIAVAQMLGLLREISAEQVAEASFRESGLPRELADDGHQMLSDRATRRALQAMLREAVPYDEETRRPDWEAIEQLERDYANVDLPTLILWGSRDESWPVAMGYKLRAQLPRAWLLVLAGRMHLLPTEAPGEVAQAVREFLRPGYAERPAIVVQRDAVERSSRVGVVQAAVPAATPASPAAPRGTEPGSGAGRTAATIEASGPVRIPSAVGGSSKYD